MVASLYDRYVRLPTTDEEWLNEIRGIFRELRVPLCRRLGRFLHLY